MRNIQGAKPAISVVVASYNGGDVLPITFDALNKVIYPEGGVEFILVDNCSTDSTSRLMRDFLVDKPGKYIYEKNPGKSIALNTGVREALGDIVVFTDDDVIPDQWWLVNFFDATQRFRDFGIFGGQIRLEWPIPPAPWQQEIENRGRTLGATPIDRTNGEMVFSEIKGANYCIRQELLTYGCTFDSDLGVSSSGAMLAGEETAFVKKLNSKGVRIFFVKDAIVRHIVRNNQVTIYSMIKRGFRNGRGGGQSERVPLPRSRIYLFGIPGYIYIQVSKLVLFGVFKFLLKKSAIDKADAVSELIRAAEIAGFAFQVRNFRPD